MLYMEVKWLQCAFFIFKQILSIKQIFMVSAQRSNRLCLLVIIQHCYHNACSPAMDCTP